MDAIILENFRCFRGRHEIPLAPLTFLVGENSTGKTSFLAAVRLAWDLTEDRFSLDFNEEPFHLGTLDTIANARGRGPRRFGIGYAVAGDSASARTRPRGQSRTEAVSTFARGAIEPGRERWTARAGEYAVAVSCGRRRRALSTSAEGEEREFEIRATTPDAEAAAKVKGKPWVSDGFVQGVLAVMGPRYGEALQWAPCPPKARHMAVLRAVVRAGWWDVRTGERPFAMSPIRTEPLRTYEPLRAAPGPSGAHTPAALLAAARSTPVDYERLRLDLAEWGRSGALFDRLDVRSLGDTDSSPFQIAVDLGGFEANLIDVGYGVSQVLPILWECLRRGEGHTLLLQQPEVHLHPRAQAMLGTFFGSMAKQKGMRFVVETHSDYILDRVRTDVRDKREGSVTPDDVLILYFEREGTDVIVHPIRIDEVGNLVGAPPSYGSFFLAEERRFLGL